MTVRLLPCLLFLALLLLPAFAQLTGYPKVAPLEEYRALAEWPDPDAYLAADEGDFLDYTAKLNAWHLDHFATRAFWVRLRTQALYSLFGESDKVYIGPENWLFYRSVIDVETPILQRIPDENRRALVNKISLLSDLLQERGITLYVAPLALKHRYYPEFLPAAAGHAKRLSFYDTFVDELLASDGINLIDSRSLLQQAKADGMQTFHRTDFHWTDPASALVARSLLEAIAEREGQEQIIDQWHYELVDPVSAGGQARALPLLKTPTERFHSMVLRSPLTRFDYQTSDSGIEWSGKALPGQGPLLMPVLAFGDSFIDAWSRAGFFNFFQSFATARIYRTSLAEAYAQRQPGTRYLVMEWITSATFSIDQEVSALIAELQADPVNSDPPPVASPRTESPKL